MREGGKNAPLVKFLYTCDTFEMCVWFCVFLHTCPCTVCEFVCLDVSIFFKMCKAAENVGQANDYRNCRAFSHWKQFIIFISLYKALHVGMISEDLLPRGTHLWKPYLFFHSPLLSFPKAKHGSFVLLFVLTVNLQGLPLNCGGGVSAMSTSWPRRQNSGSDPLLLWNIFGNISSVLCSIIIYDCDSYRFWLSL